ncbi:hypothetical protein [Terrihabitans rhizophilus]|uniref:Uncharacterized protein n=1 Tax=Terrihabitans rhizophilus TaxID=3092662 RepID=A0ABU4RRZ3_9HYPH|nr:hypothetical protein [Terrihabitans sp. PJ23]MDX6806440.1 hypothetical protein [Terrihabitans sp. PJ23]
MSTYVNDETYQNAVTALANACFDPITGRPDASLIKTILGEQLDIWPQAIRLDVARSDAHLDLTPYRKPGGGYELDLSAYKDDANIAAHEPKPGDLLRNAKAMVFASVPMERLEKEARAHELAKRKIKPEEQD